MAPPPPRPQWHTLRSLYDTHRAESRASLRVYSENGNSCVKGAVRLQRYGDTLLFRLAYEGNDAPGGRVTDKTRRGCVYLPAEDLVNWGIRMRMDRTSTGRDVQVIDMQFGAGILCADGHLSITITIPMSDDSDDTFFAGLIFADQERRRILTGR